MVSMAKAMDPSCSASSVVVYLQAYFVTIATILGTGILGLPVTLTQSGLYPFLISFLVDAVMQSILIHFFVDLLQRACALQLQNLKEETVPLNTISEEDVILESDEDGVVMKEFELPAVPPLPILSPNLHLLGKFFLGCGFQHTFDVLIILQFAALLVCYALAGSEAYAQIIGINHIIVIPVFIWVLTFAIVFALRFIQPVVSILTFLKGTVLLATTVVTFYVGVLVGRTIHNDFVHVGAPFLMGTVALGGTINTMPVTYEKIPYKRNQIAHYRLAVQLGLWTCVVLNILWCWSVLDIVPQTISQACGESSGSLVSVLELNSSAENNNLHSCYGELSLESAKLNGEISTIPLTKILEKDYSRYKWVAVLVEVFIMVSITVSYLTIGTALHHTVSGIVQTFIISRSLKFDTAPNKFCNKEKILASLASFLAFILIFIVALSNPQGFVNILEKFASLTLNIQAGLFVFLMLLKAPKLTSIDIPLPMQRWIYPLKWTIPLFFGGAVVFDVYTTIYEFIHPVQLVPVKLNASHSDIKVLAGTTDITSTTLAAH